jgi:dienelactone hydrolase
VIAFHGWADSAVPPEQVVALGEELSGVGADWQIHCFGGAVHGFTHLGDAEGGVQFNALAASRSWRTLETFLGECFV